MYVLLSRHIILRSRAKYEIQVDSAIMYRNEKGCGRAIQNSGLDRSEVFLTTKIPPESMGYEETKRAVDTSLRAAGQEYFDLYV